MTTNKIPFALMDGRLIDVTQADKKIDYSCPDCNAVLRKRGGNIVTDHFYHYTPSDCSGESVIHKAYKQAILECKELCYRDYKGDIKTLKFDRVELEKGFNSGSLIIDAVGYIDKEMYFIEFANTHYIDARKKKKIQAANIFCIEISTNKNYKYFDEIIDYLMNDLPFKNVINSPLSNTFKAKYDILNRNYQILNNSLNDKNKKLKIYESFNDECNLKIKNLTDEISVYKDNIAELKFELNLQYKHDKQLNLFNHKNYLEFRRNLIDTIRGLKNCEHYPEKNKNYYIKEIIKQIESYLIHTRQL